VVDDQTLGPTYTSDLAAKLREVILADGVPYGVYHMTAGGACSWFEFAREIFRIAGLTADLAPQRTAEAGFRARRPRYSVLANDALAAAGIDQIRPWSAGLREYLGYRLGIKRGVGG
jgi:dTDP-4-dehydrorhamnose reductase